MIQAILYHFKHGTWRVSTRPDKAEVRLLVLEARHPRIGKLGLLQYVEPHSTTARQSIVSMGEPILDIETEDVDYKQQMVSRRPITAARSETTIA